MKIITKRESIIEYVDRFIALCLQLKSESSKPTLKALLALDKQTCTSDELDAALQLNLEKRWFWLPDYCDECGLTLNVAMQLGEAPDYESATATICLPCLLTATKLLTETN